MKVLTLIKLLLKVFSEGLSALNGGPLPPLSGKQHVSPGYMRRMGEGPNYPGTALSLMLLGIAWMVLFGLMLWVYNQQSADYSEDFAEEVYAPPVSADLPAVVLNHEYLRQHMLAELHKLSPNFQGSLRAEVHLDKNGNYMNHRIIQVSHDSMIGICRVYLKQIQCLPALKNGHPVASRVYLRYSFYSH